MCVVTVATILRVGQKWHTFQLRQHSAI